MLYKLHNFWSVKEMVLKINVLLSTWFNWLLFFLSNFFSVLNCFLYTPNIYSWIYPNTPFTFLFRCAIKNCLCSTIVIIISKASVRVMSNKSFKLSSSSFCLFILIFNPIVGDLCFSRLRKFSSNFLLLTIQF